MSWYPRIETKNKTPKQTLSAPKTTTAATTTRTPRMSREEEREKERIKGRDTLIYNKIWYFVPNGVRTCSPAPVLSTHRTAVDRRPLCLSRVYRRPKSYVYASIVYFISFVCLFSPHIRHSFRIVSAAVLTLLADCVVVVVSALRRCRYRGCCCCCCCDWLSACPQVHTIRIIAAFFIFSFHLL